MVSVREFFERTPFTVAYTGSVTKFFTVFCKHCGHATTRAGNPDALSAPNTWAASVLHHRDCKWIEMYFGYFQIQRIDKIHIDNLNGTTTTWLLEEQNSYGLRRYLDVLS